MQHLKTDGYMRAGLFVLPFCIIGWFVKHEAIYWLAGGFFVALLSSSLISQYRKRRCRPACVASTPPTFTYAS